MFSILFQPRDLCTSLIEQYQLDLSLKPVLTLMLIPEWITTRDQSILCLKQSASKHRVVAFK
jgi:hypothetical protein